MDRGDLRNYIFNFWNTDLRYFSFARLLNLDYKDSSHPFHLEIIRTINAHELVLDLGCGSAEIGREISNKGASYFGIDISTIGLKLAADYRKEGVSLTKCNVENIPFKDNSFDVVISVYSLEHFLYPEKILREAHRVLKQNGRIMILSEAYDNPLVYPPSLCFSAISHLSFRDKIKSKRFKELFYHFYNRFKYIMLQFFKQIRLNLSKSYYSFEMISKPRILNEAYSQDFDVVYIVSIREIINFLKLLGMSIEFVKSNASAFSFTKYFIKPLFVIARKY